MRYGPQDSLTSEKVPSSNFAAINWLENKLGHVPDAEDLIHRLPAEELEAIIRELGQERYANRIAKAIKRQLPMNASKELADVITDAVPKNYEHGRLHPATRTFQALRIAVNRELESL